MSLCPDLQSVPPKSGTIDDSELPKSCECPTEHQTQMSEITAATDTDTSPPEGTTENLETIEVVCGKKRSIEGLFDTKMCRVECHCGCEEWCALLQSQAAWTALCLR